MEKYGKLFYLLRRAQSHSPLTSVSVGALTHTRDLRSQFGPGRLPRMANQVHGTSIS